MPKGRVFSIEEFSTYDGPGIRTTVFLKGCPLRCMWCHNPEGQRREAEHVRSPNGCLGCGACLAAGQRVTGHPCLVPESVGVCPNGLVRISGVEYTAAELITVLEKNFAILNMSGGGVTFSGGEPLLSADFLRECLTLLRDRTHRALQTSGYAPANVFSEVLAECDYVLYDLKLMNDEEHKRYTGVSNQSILANYRLLAASGKPFITRIPLIPTVNDGKENIETTAFFMRENGANIVELLPYNKMAGSKYKMLGRDYRTTFDGALTPQPHREIFEKYKIEVKVL